MRATFCCPLLTAVLPMGYALQAYTDQNTCPWSRLPSAFEQFVYSPMNVMDSPNDIRDRGSSHLHNNNNGLESNTWSTSPDCFGEYCVYTSNDFLGKGISLVTTASNHIRIAQIQIPETASKTGYEKARIVEIPAKGKGLIATRKIRRGERIMAASPSLLVHRNAFRELQLEDIYYLMDMAVNNLPKARKESYLAQSGTMGGHKITDILFTNSFQVALGDYDGFHYGNFPEVSILNHDCRPK